MQVSNNGSKAKMAERKSAYVPKSPSFVSSNSTGWDPEQARKLIQESARLHPPPVVIFVRPAPKFTPKFDVRRRDNKPSPQSRVMADSFANSVLVAKTQRRMGGIKMTEEDYEQFASKELSRKRRK